MIHYKRCRPLPKVTLCQITKSDSKSGHLGLHVPLFPPNHHISCHLERLSMWSMSQLSTATLCNDRRIRVAASQSVSLTSQDVVRRKRWIPEVCTTSFFPIQLVQRVQHVQPPPVKIFNLTRKQLKKQFNQKFASTPVHWGVGVLRCKPNWDFSQNFS